MNETEKLELKGRLYLWHMALCETNDLLNQAFQLEELISKPETDEEYQVWIKPFQKFRESQEDYKVGSILASHYVKFCKLNPKPFPVITDYSKMKESNIMLAVVIFCQIFNIGHGEDSIASKNTKEFINVHMESILKKVFPNDDKLNEFNSLKKQLLTARDKMIGHADAKAFQISHGIPASSLKMYSFALENIDIKKWRELIEPLIPALLEYMNENTR